LVEIKITKSTLPEASFAGVNTIKLEISKCLLGNIPQNAFKNAHISDSLTIIDCNIDKIQSNAFAGAVIGNIRFEKNEIEAIQSEGISPLKTNNVFLLANTINKLYEVSIEPKNIFEGLLIKSNKINLIGTNAILFQNAKYLHFFNFESNKIQEMKSNVFGDLNKLPSFNIFNNNIGQMDQQYEVVELKDSEDDPTLTKR